MLINRDTTSNLRIPERLAALIQGLGNVFRAIAPVKMAQLRSVVQLLSLLISKYRIAFSPA